MKSRKQWLDCAQVKEIDLEDYLAASGYEPKKIENNNYWFLLPLRVERATSFKVNRKLNRWYGHGLGKGRNLIDFAILYHDCTIVEFLQTLQENFSFHKPFSHQQGQISTENKIQILGDFMLSSIALLSYLDQHRIPYEIADRFCREVGCHLNGKSYYSIGFKNDAGCCELRNPYFKNSSTPKGITTIRIGTGKIAVFEGFLEFLSLLVLLQNQQPFEWDYCFLNSIVFFEKTISLLEQYELIHIFLDNDEAGQNCSLSTLKPGKKWINESSMYRNCKDLNEWIMTMGKLPP